MTGRWTMLEKLVGVLLRHCRSKLKFLYYRRHRILHAMTLLWRYSRFQAIVRFRFSRAESRSTTSRLRLQYGSKCNEALSEDLWPLDPFESAPMRATSSVLSNSIPYANLDLL